MAKKGRQSNYLGGEYKEFVHLVYDKYGSIGRFCIHIGVNQANLNSNLDNRYRMSMDRMFTCANALEISIEQMIVWFWKAELENNRENMNTGKTQAISA